MPDLRFVFRTLARNRGFTLVTVLTLALGIGSAASIFSVADWILFRRPTYPQDLYLIGGQNNQNPFMPVRFDFMAQGYIEQTNVMSAYAKAAYLTGNVVIADQPVATSWLGVSANLFPLLGVKPALGRGFLPGEDAAGADHVVVISHNFWKRHFGGKPDVLGKQITVGGTVSTVVGVLREGQLMPGVFYQRDLSTAFVSGESRAALGAEFVFIGSAAARQQSRRSGQGARRRQIGRACLFAVLSGERPTCLIEHGRGE